MRQQNLAMRMKTMCLCNGCVCVLFLALCVLLSCGAGQRVSRLARGQQQRCGRASDDGTAATAAARGANAAHNACSSIAGRWGGRVLLTRRRCSWWYCRWYCRWYCISSVVIYYHWNLASTSTSSYRWAALSQLRSWFMPRSCSPLQARRQAGKNRQGRVVHTRRQAGRHAKLVAGKLGGQPRASLLAGCVGFWRAGHMPTHLPQPLQPLAHRPAGPPASRPTHLKESLCSR